MIYVVAPVHRSAQLFLDHLRASGVDTRGMKIVTREIQLLGLPQGVQVIRVLDNGYLKPEMHDRLKILKAGIKTVVLDSLYGVERPYH
jgi:hypothetical protein